MLEGDKIKVAQGENPCYLLLNQANRHGLIAGASGTGKTVTMKVLAEGFAQAGVPVFMADVKGDVTGMAQPGDDTEKVRERAAALGADGWEPRGCDVRLWDMLGGRVGAQQRQPSARTRPSIPLRRCWSWVPARHSCRC